MNKQVTTPKFIVVSPSHVDIFTKGDFEWGRVHSESAQIFPMPGGGGRNVAENLARLGSQTTLLTIVGDDVWGKFVCEHTITSGVNVVPTYSETVQTPIYLSLNDESGNTILDMFTGGECHALFSSSFGQQHINHLLEGNFYITNTDISEDLFFFLAEYADKTGNTLAVQVSAPSTASKIMGWLSKVDLLILNELEANIILNGEASKTSNPKDITDKLLAYGPSNVLLTLGSNGACVATANGIFEYKSVISSENPIVSTIGAGDAVCAGFLYGIANQYEISYSLLLGLATATVNLATEEVVNRNLNSQLIHTLANKSLG